MIRAGLLVDENGELIKDIAEIQFGDAIETEAEKTRKAFEGITEAIQESDRDAGRIAESDQSADYRPQREWGRWRQ